MSKLFVLDMNNYSVLIVCKLLFNSKLFEIIYLLTTSSPKINKRKEKRKKKRKKQKTKQKKMGLCVVKPTNQPTNLNKIKCNK